MNADTTFRLVFAAILMGGSVAFASILVSKPRTRDWIVMVVISIDCIALALASVWLVWDALGGVLK